MVNRRQLFQISVAAAAVTTPLFAAGPAGAAGNLKRPLVIGHRGASGYRPEHTLASYELAARTGADFIEPDLVITADGVLVARHENEISGTTDVAARPEFAARRTTKTIDGVSLTGWFTEDFTLPELKTLRTIERIPSVRQCNTVYNGYFDVRTLDEVLDLRAQLSRELLREIGVYPETKHPTCFQAIGKPLEAPLVRTLERHGLDHKQAPVFVQSFESANLRRLANQPRHRGTPRRRLGRPSSLVADAHAAGLAVHPWTFRNESQFLPPSLRLGTDPNAYGKAVDEQIAFLRAGVDGLFTDKPGHRCARPRPGRRVVTVREAPAGACRFFPRHDSELAKLGQDGLDLEGHAQVEVAGQAASVRTEPHLPTRRQGLSFPE